jgi:hypothetical protein
MNRIDNGLLSRAGVHDLIDLGSIFIDLRMILIHPFDLGLITIDPRRMTIAVDSAVNRGSYRRLVI